jgi:DNA-binding FrmR family transcriptional regulator
MIGKQKETETVLHHNQINALKRIEGQIRGLQKMILEKKYCVDILLQFKSAHSALRRVELEIIKCYVGNCVAGAAKFGTQI